jgi:hypothetical protein
MGVRKRKLAVDYYKFLVHGFDQIVQSHWMSQRPIESACCWHWLWKRMSSYGVRFDWYSDANERLEGCARQQKATTLPVKQLVRSWWLNSVNASNSHFIRTFCLLGPRSAPDSCH